MSQHNQNAAIQRTNRAEVEHLVQQVEDAQHLLNEHHAWLLHELPDLVVAIVQGLEAGQVAFAARHMAEGALASISPTTKATVLDRTGPLPHRSYIGDMMQLAVVNENAGAGQLPFRIAWQGHFIPSHGYSIGRM